MQPGTHTNASTTYRHTVYKLDLPTNDADYRSATVPQLNRLARTALATDAIRELILTSEP